MKAYFIVNLCICLALLGGTVFVAQKVETATTQLEELEAGSKKDIRRVSDQLSATLTRMGRLEGKIRALQERVEGLSSQTTDAEAVEKQVRQILTEERERRRARGRGGAGQAGGGGRAGGRNEMMGRIFGGEMPKEQRELMRKMREDGEKDWNALQERVKAGEVTREEARGEVMERVGRDIQKFLKSFQKPDKNKKKPEEKPVEKKEPEEAPQPDPKKGDDKPVPPGT